MKKGPRVLQIKPHENLTKTSRKPLKKKNLTKASRVLQIKEEPP